MAQQKPKRKLVTTAITTSANCSIRQRLTVADSIDVNNTTDYKEMVKKISNEKLTIIKLIVDMRHVEKLPHSLKSSRSSEDNLLHSSESPTVCIWCFLVSLLDAANIYCRYRENLLVSRSRKPISIIVSHDGA